MQSIETLYTMSVAKIETYKAEAYISIHLSYSLYERAIALFVYEFTTENLIKKPIKHLQKLYIAERIDRNDVSHKSDFD